MSAPSSNSLHTSNSNYQAMLTTQLLDTAPLNEVPARLSTPFDYLTTSDTDADNADLPRTRRWAWYCKDPACPKYWMAWLCKSNFWLHLYETAVHREDVRTHTRAGRRELAREWRVDTDWEMKGPKQPKPARGQNGIVSGDDGTAWA